MAYQLKVVDLNNLPPANTVLCEKELAFYNRLQVPKRKTEWLGGRLALKTLLCAQLGRTLKDYEVLTPGGVGKPTVTVSANFTSPLEGEDARRAGEGENKDSGAVNIPFSLTHSNGFAVAALAPEHKYIGIDLEKIAPRLSAWKDSFFHPTELTRTDDAFLTSLWTQKEALVKLLGPGLTINTQDVRVVGGAAQFYGRALEIYTALGAPQITLETSSLRPGFCFSVAVA